MEDGKTSWDDDHSSQEEEDFSISDIDSNSKLDVSSISNQNQSKKIKALQDEVEFLKRNLEFRDEELQRLKAEKQKMLPVLRALYASDAEAQRQKARSKLEMDFLRIGKMCTRRTGHQLQEVWEDGCLLEDLKDEMIQLSDQKKRLQSDFEKKGNFVDDDEIVSNEIYITQLERIARMEEELRERIAFYERRKHLVISEAKRIQYEDESHFLKENPVLKDRYVLLNLLGRGGFCEVFKAFDIEESKNVACKIHTMNNNWGEERKMLFIKHLTREQTIQKGALHRNIVRMLDSFPSGECSVSVLEYCKGNDLSSILRERTILPEKEAKSIISQIFSGLLYLNRLSPQVIHYDLKPANVLIDFDDYGIVAKLTDFGISKWMDKGLNDIKLSSEGFGTYWYLPPESFLGKERALISTKVDVWSAGIVFYEMLYGRVPFGHGQSEYEIITNGLILNAHQLEFPDSGPPVSQEAKAFIQKCLTHNQQERPDVPEIVQDKYLGFKIKPKTSASGSVDFSSFNSSLRP